MEKVPVQLSQQVFFMFLQWSEDMYAQKLQGKQLYVTNEESCYRISSTDHTSVVCENVPCLTCHHDEADTRIWHWKSHWKVQPHWKTTETTLKSFTKDNYTEIFSLITLKYVCYCYPRMLILYNPTENFQRYSYPLFSQFSALLWFFSVIFSVIFS